MKFSYFNTALTGTN